VLPSRFVLLTTYLIVLVPVNEAHAFSRYVDSTSSALVDTDLSSIRTPIEVYIDREAGECNAMLKLAVAELPSRSLVPRPRELADRLVPVAKSFGVKTCEIGVWTYDDRAAEEERYSEEACRRGKFRYDAVSWSELEDDRPCW
jgi:hypothetical protein